MMSVTSEFEYKLRPCNS